MIFKDKIIPKPLNDEEQGRKVVIQKIIIIYS